MNARLKTLMFLAVAASAVVSAVAAPIRLKSGEIDPSVGSPKMTTTATASLYAADEGVRVYLIQCEGAVSPGWRSTIEQAGGKILGYVPDNAYLVAADRATAAAIADRVVYAYFGDYRPEYKLAASVKDVLSRAVSMKMVSNDTNFKTSAYAGEFVLSVFPFAKASDVAEKISALDGCVVLDADGDAVRARLSESAVETIVSWPEIEWLEPYVEKSLSNNVAVEQPRMNVKTVWPSGASGLGLTGTNQVVAVCDTGLDTGSTGTLHEDVRGRVTRTYSVGRSSSWNDPNGHGTHVVGSVLGNGAKSSGTFRGSAYEANLIFQSILNARGGLTTPSDLKRLFQQAYDAESGKPGARLHSNSWGAGDQVRCPGYLGYYSSESRAIDQFMFEHPDMLIFFAAGNEGVDYDGDGVIEADSISTQGSAKNCMTVGAAENERTINSGGYTGYKWATGSWASNFRGSVFKNDYISRPYDGTHQGMAAFSSRGPCDDGRIKPDIVAPGTDIVSLQSSATSSTGWGRYNSYYAYMGGTSMATPLTAGAAVLVRQWLVEKQAISNPDGATVKAVMLAGAKSLTPGQYGTGATREIPASYPNNVEGWGQVNLGNSLANSSGVAVFDGKIIGHGETQEYKVTVASAGSPLAIVMAYMDAPAALSSSAQLVNDLDLTVTTPTGETLYPNSRTSPDRINNVEGVRIASALRGVYTIRVNAYSIKTPMSTSWTGGKANATRYSVAVNGASQSAALEIGTCLLSNSQTTMAAASGVTDFSVGETIYAYVRIHNPGTVAQTDGFMVKHELLAGSVAKGDLEKTYEETIAAGGNHDITAYAWSGLQNLSAGSYTYRFTLKAPGAADVQREVAFTVAESPGTLQSVVISGASTVGGGTRSAYTCRATLSDGKVVTVTPVWTLDTGSAYASIGQDGVLDAYATEGVRIIVLRATCTYNGVSKSGTMAVAIIPTLSLPAALDWTGPTPISGGSAEWFGQRSVTHDKVDAAQSGAIANGQTSWFETTVTGPGTLSFWFRTSTELNCDKLEVRVDGTRMFWASGKSDWTQHSIYVDEGQKVVRFAYVKDVSLSSGDDAVYLDQLVWTTEPTPVSLTITGESTVTAGTALQLGCTALMSDGTSRDVGSAATWSLASGSAYASVSPTGLLTAHPSTVDRSVVVNASYMSGGVTKSDSRMILIEGVAPVPSAPVITRAGEGDTEAAVLGWTAADNAARYRVYRSTGTDVASATLLATPGNVLSYRDTTASPGVDYSYWVSAVNESGETVSARAKAYRAVRLTVTEYAVTFDSPGGSTNLAFKSNAAVEASCAMDWLTVVCADSVVRLTAQANEASAERGTVFTLTAAKGTDHPKSLVIEVVQNGKTAPEQLPPDLAFAVPGGGWAPACPMYTADPNAAGVAKRLFAVGECVLLRYGWGNVGQGAAQGTVTNVIVVGTRKQDIEPLSVNERDIELDVLTSNAIPVSVELEPGVRRADSLEENGWTSLPAGVYVAKATLNADGSMVESDRNNNAHGFRFAVCDPETLEKALDCESSTLKIAETSTNGWYGTKGIGLDGADCAMTRLLGDGSQCVLTATTTGAGTLTFAYRVATEASADTLSFKADGSELLKDSGIGEWKQVSFDVAAGDHTFVWTYAKDSTGSDGDDCVYLDQVVWTPVLKGSAPTDLRASDGEQGSYVVLRWTAVSGAKSYVIERAESVSGPWTTVVSGQTVSPAYDSTPALGGVEYCYRIKSVYSDGESDWCETPDVGYRKVEISSCVNRTVPGIAGSDAILKTANCIWEATVKYPSGYAGDEWLTLDDAMGTNDFKLVYKFSYNGTGKTRSCEVTITGAPGTSHAAKRTFTVTQRVPADNGTVIGLNAATDCPLTFRNSPDAPWFGQTRIKHGDKNAMRSAEISGDDVSRVEVALARAGELSFWWGTSSEKKVDVLRCYVNGVAVTNVSGYGDSDAGKTDVKNWQWISLKIPQGGAVVAWEYAKDSSKDVGLDAGYVSEIVWTPDTVDIVPPETWFSKYPDLLSRLGVSDYAAAAKMRSPGSVGSGGKSAADGSDWLVWMDYVCGTDPLDSNSKFRATIEIVDGVPKVEWSPKLSDEETKLRNYLIHGKKNLTETEWSPVADGHEIEYNFFKVSVEMQ